MEWQRSSRFGTASRVVFLLTACGFAAHDVRAHQSPSGCTGNGIVLNMTRTPDCHYIS